MLKFPMFSVVERGLYSEEVGRRLSWYRLAGHKFLEFSRAKCERAGTHFGVEVDIGTFTERSVLCSGWSADAGLA